MKLALLGDIHGNDRALRAILAAASSSGVDELLITGDLVGYYFAPREVVELLQQWNHHIVRGNHEDMLKTARTDPMFLKQVDALYGNGLRSAIEQLNEDQLDDLCSLPHPLVLELDGTRILLCHGAPWDNGCYIYPDAQSGLLDQFEIKDFDLVVLGHTHHPMEHSIGETLVVNPGSAGQPRNHQKGAHWALFDTATRNVEFRLEQYDICKLVQECRQRNPKLPYIADVLERPS